MFSSDLVDSLRACQYRPSAACRYDVMAGGLIWDDELPTATNHAPNLRAAVHLRKVVAYRASLSLNEPRAELESDWTELKHLLPGWPGFREDRIFGEAQRILKIHKYKEAKVLDRLERGTEGDG